MPNSVLNQLKALRDGVAQDLRKDPRYLTLQALDKSIEEISTVLSSAGLLPASAPPSSLSQRLGGLAPQANPYAEPVAVLGKDTKAGSQSATASSPDHAESPARPTPGFKDGTAGVPHPAVPRQALPLFSEPALEVAVAVAEEAGALHGEPRHEAKADSEAPALEPEQVPREAEPGHAHAEPEARAELAEVAEPIEAKAHASVDESSLEAEVENTAAFEPHAEAGGPAVADQSDEATAEDAPGDPSASDHPTSETLTSETSAVAALLEADEAPRENLDAVAPHLATEAPAESPARTLDIGAAPRSELPVPDETTAANASALSALAAALFREEAAPESGAPDEPGVTPLHAEHDSAEPRAGAAENADESKDSLTADLEAALEELAADAASLDGDEQFEAETAHEPSAPHVLDAGETQDDAATPAFETTAAFESIVADAIATALSAEDARPVSSEDHEKENDASAPQALTSEEALSEALEGALEEARVEAADAGEAAERVFETLIADAIAAALLPEEDAAEAAHHLETESVATREAVETPESKETPSDSTRDEAGDSEGHAFEMALAEAMTAAFLAGGDATAHAVAEPDDIGAGQHDAPDEPAAAVFPEGEASGYIPMAPRAGAPQYSPSIAVKFGKLPGRVDLRPLLAPIEDQGEINSSVANAVAGAYEYWIRKATKKPQHISRLFVYYNARWRAGTQDSDSGCAIQLALEGLQKFGACAETAWPSNPELLTQRPGAEAYRDGAPYRVHDMAQVPLKPEAWKQALAEGKPIIFGLAVFDSFAGCASRGGVVPMPAPNDVPRKAHRVHAMCAVGYNELERVFIVRNSWGEAFGDKGYCYIPFDYLLNPKFNDGDNWIFVPKVPSQPPRETWQESQTPVTNGGQGVDFPIEPYQIGDYERVSTDLFEQTRKPWTAHVTESYGDYAGKVGKNLFDELESFDVTSFLAASAGDANPSAPAKRQDEPKAAVASAHDDDEWGNAAAWGASTAMAQDHDPAKHEAPEKASADAELTHSLP
ncbi:MAG: C1 family peptidase [Beijerinckiaceae bacterium]|nr:C1 family peptidase [Beijerinckiaceae bacterium]